MTGLREEYPGENLETLCGLFGKTRQAYYKKKKTLVTKSQIRIVLLEGISYYRSLAPCMGGIKLYHELSCMCGSELTGGRDSFLRFLRQEKLMLPVHKRRHTTKSDHIYRKYPNLIKRRNSPLSQSYMGQ